MPDVKAAQMASKEKAIANDHKDKDNHPDIVAELFIDGNDYPLIRLGERVLLQFEGWPAVQFAAYPKAAVGTFEGKVYLIDPTSDPQGRFRILVEPAGDRSTWPPDRYLYQGVRAQGWVVANHVSLAYELWRVINGFPVAAEIERSNTGTRLGPIKR